METVRSRAINGVIPKLGAIAVSTPGALDAWWTLHQRYGRLKWSEILEPAIHLCEAGVPVPQIIGFYIKRNLAVFSLAGLRSGGDGQCKAYLCALRRSPR